MCLSTQSQQKKRFRHTLQLSESESTKFESEGGSEINCDELVSPAPSQNLDFLFIEEFVASAANLILPPRDLLTAS